jgi:Family of unknown function (DUF6152)
MSRVALRSVFLLLPLLGIAGMAKAHHPPRFERCQLVSIEGAIERIDWDNPHVRLILKSDQGESYELGWLSPRALRRADIDIDLLHIGDRVVVETGFRPQDAEKQPLLLSGIRRTSDGWTWSQEPQGC